MSQKRDEFQKCGNSTNVAVINVAPKNSVSLKFEEVTLTALFDTGSDISAFREDIYKKYFENELLSSDIIKVKGLGLTKINTLGSLSKRVEINGDNFNVLFHVLPNEVTNFQVILGNNVLEQAEVHISDEGVIVSKIKELNNLMRISIDEEGPNENDLDIGDISNPVHKKTITDMVNGYQPLKIKTSDVQMKIILKNEEPIYQRPRRLSILEKEEVDKQIEEWLEEGIIKESSSDFASPIVLVKKKNGATRICCDYRKLNKVIVKDRFPLPLIEDVLDKLEGTKNFSTIDLKNGFFHVDVEESSTKYTSFVTPNGQYEFLKCPFGLCNSPAVFQRFINNIFRPLTSKNYMIY